MNLKPNDSALSEDLSVISSLSKMAYARALICLWTVTSSTGCGTDGVQAVRTLSVDLYDAFEVVESIRLEESGNTLLVWPMVTVDVAGRFIVADLQQAQAYVYGRDGGLINVFGRRGSGPGEFQSAAAAVRLPDGQVFVSDLTQRVAVFDPHRDSLSSTSTWPFHRVDQVQVLDDSLMIVAAIENGDPDSPRLHIWNNQRHELVRSFFRPMESVPHRDVALMGGWTRFAMRGDTIAATFAVSDSIHLMLLNGEMLDVIPLPSGLIRRPTPRPPSVASGDRRARAAWQASYDLVSSVYWVTDGRLVVSYQTFSNNTPLFSVAVMDRQGSLLSNVKEAPRLLASTNDQLVFVDPASEVPNAWQILRARDR